MADTKDKMHVFFFLRQYVKHAVQRQAENSVAQAAAVEEKQQANPASHYSLKVFLYVDSASYLFMSAPTFLSGFWLHALSRKTKQNLIPNWFLTAAQKL